MQSDSHQASRSYYLDFEMEIGQGSGREYPVAVLDSPAGEARVTMWFPYDELALDNRLLTLQNALLRSGRKPHRTLSPEEQGVQDFGNELFKALFTSDVRSCYDFSLREAERQGRGLRLKLRILSPEMAALPWEYLYHPGQADYVSLSTQTPVVRYLEVPRCIEPLTVTPPLRILGMVASPSDLNPLDVTREKQRIERAIEDLRTRGLVDLVWLPGQSWRSLHGSMRQGPWHIFHFVGHGGFDRHNGEGLVALANREGKSVHFTATKLGRLLRDHRSLRLVLLNSCEGARGNEHDIFSSTAATLVRGGIPAVVAMQFEITDRAAIEFAHTFYGALADGMPVDGAVADARKAISFAVNNTVEWGTPVLYMHAPDGVLFQMTGQEIAAQKRQAELQSLYSVAVLAADAERWEEARELLVRVGGLERGFRDTERLLAKVEAEIEQERRKEMKRQRQEQSGSRTEDTGNQIETRFQREESQPPSPKLAKRPLVAVANLENRGQEEHESKCFGVSSYLRRILEAIPTEHKFGVVPISGMMGFDSDSTPSEVYAKTGVRFLLKGALDLRLDPGVIEAELWWTEDDTLLWHKEFAEPWKDVQSTTKRIALSVVKQVLMHTQASAKTEVEKRIANIKNLIVDFPEQRPYHFELFNRGIFRSNRFNNLRKDEDFLYAVFDLDKVAKSSKLPHYEALAELGFIYILRWETKGDPRLLQQSEKRWEQILESKPAHPFALVELGYVSCVSGSRDPIEAIKLARRAVDSDPEHAIAHNVLALLYLYLGYYESNITIETTEVFPRSPTYVYPRTNVALAQQLRGHYEEALEFAIEARDIQPKAFVANLLVGAQYFYMGQLDKADRAWAEGQKHCPVKVVASILGVARAWIQVREGNIASAQETLQANANAAWLPGPYGPYYSSLAALVGENERAITLLEKDPTFARSYRYLISEPTLEPLKDDPRFHSLLEKRHKEWIRNLDELEAGLPNPLECCLPSPEEFLGK